MRWTIMRLHLFMQLRYYLLLNTYYLNYAFLLQQRLNLLYSA